MSWSATTKASTSSSTHASSATDIQRSWRRRSPMGSVVLRLRRRTHTSRPCDGKRKAVQTRADSVEPPGRPSRTKRIVCTGLGPVWSGQCRVLLRPANVSEQLRRLRQAVPARHSVRIRLVPPVPVSGQRDDESARDPVARRCRYGNGGGGSRWGRISRYGVWQRNSAAFSIRIRRKRQLVSRQRRWHLRDQGVISLRQPDRGVGLVFGGGRSEQGRGFGFGQI